MKQTVPAVIKLPQEPFKIIEADEKHPLVLEALRSRRHFESCWCGSGRKFKKCHQFREQESPLTLGQILHEQQQVFWKPRGCMHPRASNATCEGKIVDSHTIQRKGPLSRIVDARNHVCKLAPSASQEAIELVEVGWKQASVFPGYCAKHDSDVFAALEHLPFAGTHEQCVLQTYRSVCNELYKKRAFIESLEYQQHAVDRGRDLDGQISWQLSVLTNLEGQAKSKKELEELWHKFDDAIEHHRYDRFASKCYFFDGDLSVTSSGALHTEFDFAGRKLTDMWDLTVDAEMLAHAVMSTGTGGAIVFTWLSEQELPAAVVKSFDEVPDKHKGDVFVQYCFLNCENTFFSREWWERQTPQRQAQLKRYAEAFFYEGGAFVPSSSPLVDWNFIRHHSAGEE